MAYDLTGHVQALGPWKVLALPAIAPADEAYKIETPFGNWTHRRAEGEALHPEREPLSVLEAYRRAQGEEIFSAQFQQAPVKPGGNMIKLDLFQRFDLDASPVFERIFHSWDTASKATELSNYSVCTVWGVAKGKIYLLNVVRERFEYPDLREIAIATAKGRAPALQRPDLILIEDKASGQGLIQDLKREGLYNLVPVKPAHDKLTRMSTQTAQIANGAVYLPVNAPWLPVFEHECIAFPRGKYDDQVDSLSQALEWFAANKDAPNLTTYYREEYVRLHEPWRKSQPEAPSMRMRPRVAGSNIWLPPDNSPAIMIEADGSFLVPERHVKNLRIAGWMDAT